MEDFCRHVETNEEGFCKNCGARARIYLPIELTDQGLRKIAEPVDMRPVSSQAAPEQETCSEVSTAKRGVTE